MGYWLPVSDWNVNRFLVMVSAIALIVISALSLSAGGSTAHMVHSLHRTLTHKALLSACFAAQRLTARLCVFSPL